MMDGGRVAKMQVQGESVAVKFLEFTRAVAKSPGKVICFFEGEDLKYFSVRLDVYLGDERWSPISCGGKKNVLSLREVISGNDSYRESKRAFFVDADFFPEDSIGLDLVYTTPGYSIENFYVTSRVMKRVLQAEFGVDEHGDEGEEFAAVVSAFEERLNEFCVEANDFHAWIYAYRVFERESSGYKPPPLNLNNLDVGVFIEVSLGKVEAAYDRGRICANFPGCASLLDHYLADAGVRFSALEHSFRLRGKYLVGFFRIFLLALKDARVKGGSPAFRRGSNVRLALSRQNFLSELSQYADTPECLVKFMAGLSSRYFEGAEAAA